MSHAAPATTAVLNGSVAAVPSRLSGRKPRGVHSPKTSIGSPPERASKGQGSSARSMILQHSPLAARMCHGAGLGTGAPLITAGIRAAQGSDATSWAKRAPTSANVSAGGIVAPAVAYFGQKDAQQVVVIRRMVRDLAFDVCELAPTTYLCARAFNKPFTAIPVTRSSLPPPRNVE